MNISIVTDEISSDLETAIELARSWGLEAIELRGIGEHRYPDVSDFWRKKVPELILESGLKVSAISPGLFKIPFPESPPAETRILRWEDAMLFQRKQNADALFRFHLEQLLPESIKAAQELGVKTIVCFSFDRPPHVKPETPVPDGVIEILKDAARLVEQSGLTLAIEVEHICWGDTALRTAQIIEKVENPALGINWDPANAYRAGEDHPYPEGFEAVQPFVRHIHFKNAQTDSQTGERFFTFDGMIDWGGQIAALKRNGYDGYISIEPHLRPKIEMSRRSLEHLRRLIKGE
jgi:sugar phosphate isomerase/epimerase